MHDGGPAFPATIAEIQGIATNSGEFGLPGMSLRDYFAAQALRVVTSGDHVDGQGDAERHSAAAYRYADAMIAAREQK